ncbi:TDP-N-acetylfucosamine:lipid II N-acetylfucosaminyltransferase [Pedobacter sp. B4-66]|uniref:TDP-N-acetylfucosamine:lipid II N-acetylfucosaminyltransferase n=1 Tax=Pedobacter sp. B4-66 TaxID=2817280 RepID=UPI001BD965C7|nr:TDP-N-acetylfucosamine:lipid II N-acetylfucosaminyltransferase [Pedobacter sp. B4-66]
MYLHLAKDSPFVDYFIDYFSRQTPDNTFVIFGKELKHTKNKEKVILVKDFEELRDKGYRAVDFKKVFIHFLSQESTAFVLANKGYEQFYWIFWGADGYKIRELDFELLLPETEQVVNKGIWVKDRLRKFKKYILSFISKTDSYRAVQNITYCCTWVMGDLELARRLNPNIIHVPFAYLSSDELFKTEDNLVEGNHGGHGLEILLGNSLDVSNNHIDAISYLKSLKLDIDRVIFPLSYSGKVNYRELIKNRAKQNWSSKATFLEEFLPLKEYLALINSVDIVVFFHLRQQAANNSLSLLWMGKLIIMHPKSLLYRTLSDWGLSVISADLIKSQEDIEEYNQIFNDRVVNNRKILLEKFNKSAVDEYYRNLLFS